MVVSDSVHNPPYIVRLQWSRGVQRLYKPQGYNGCMQTRHNVWFVFFCSFFSILQCLKRGRMHPGARRPVPAPSAWDIRLVSALRLCWRGSQPPQEGEYIYREREIITGPWRLEGMGISTHTAAQRKLFSGRRMYHMQGTLASFQLFSFWSYEGGMKESQHAVLPICWLKFQLLKTACNRTKAYSTREGWYMSFPK